VSGALPTEGNPTVDFVLCDDAVSYAVTTPIGVNIDFTDVQGGETVSVSVDPEVDGAMTVLEVKTRDYDPTLEGSRGLHRYQVSVATVGEDLVGSASDRVGTTFVSIKYEMPEPQPYAVYRAGNWIYEDGGLNTYLDYVDEVVQKSSMIAHRTCYDSLSLASLSRTTAAANPLGEASIVAKLLRNRGLYSEIVSLRRYMYEVGPAALCDVPGTGFNVFSDGVETGYVALNSEEAAESDDIVALLKSFAVLHRLGQWAAGVCPGKPEGLEIDADQTNTAMMAIVDRVAALAESSLEARAASAQIDVLRMLTEARVESGVAQPCTLIAAGYDVTPVRQPEVDVPLTIAPAVAEAIAELPPATPAPTTTTVAAAPVVSDTVPPLPAAAEWAAAVPKLSVRAGSSVSKARLLAFVGVKAKSGSTVRITRTAASKSRCTAYKWGVKGRKAGACRVTVKVTPKKGKSVTKRITLTVTK
jgi:hypothetical protein